jgi:hypothetical protein
MKLSIRGGGSVSLTQQHFRASGGQASVYVKSGKAYKIYTDPANAIPDAKFQILKGIQDDHVIKPESILLDDKMVNVGYVMNEVQSKNTLGHLFTKDFRNRNKITQDNIVTISSKVRERLPHIHSAGALVIDLNAMNMLVPDSWDDVYFIDVDSYQVAGYPATFLNPAVRDYSVKSSNGWSELSDWYSYAVLMFQLYIGVHPYGGNHSLTDKMPAKDHLEYRMRNHISAFRSGARLPKCAGSFDIIPGTFKDWLKAVLEEGKRCAPPDPKGGNVIVIPVIAPMIVSGDNLDITLVGDFGNWSLLKYFESGNNTISLISNYRSATGNDLVRILYNNRCIYEGGIVPGETFVGFTPKKLNPIGFNCYRGKLTFFDYLNKKKEVLEPRADEMMMCGDRFYIHNGSGIYELNISEIGNDCLVSASNCVANVMEQATTLYSGVAIQNMLGAIYASVFPASKTGYQIRLPELDNVKILNAKFEGGVMMVIGERKQKNIKFIFKFDEEYGNYDVREVEVDLNSDVNFVTLGSGICVTVTHEDKIEAFSAKKGSGSVKVVENDLIDQGMRLMVVGGRVGFESGGKLYQMKMK